MPIDTPRKPPHGRWSLRIAGRPMSAGLSWVGQAIVPARGRLSSAHALPVPGLHAGGVHGVACVGVGVGGQVRYIDPLGSFWQIVDPSLLKTHLLQSIWYLHAQPPLYNLLLGVALKVFGSHFGTVAHGAQIGVGVVIALSLYAALIVIGLSRWWATGTASLFVVSPSALLYENWLFYEYLVLMLLLLATLAFVGFERRPTAWRSFTLFGLLAALCYIRASFQIPLLLLVLALVLLLFSERRRASWSGRPFRCCSSRACT